MASFLIMVLLTTVAPPVQAKPIKPQDFDRLLQADANHDGTVTRAEVEAARGTGFIKLDRNRDGTLDTSDIPFLMRAMMRSKVTQSMAPFDANHDGKVSKPEFVKGPSPVFSRADSNGDGRVTPDELARAKKAAPAS